MDKTIQDNIQLDLNRTQDNNQKTQNTTEEAMGFNIIEESPEKEDTTQKLNDNQKTSTKNMDAEDGYVNFGYFLKRDGTSEEVRYHVSELYASDDESEDEYADVNHLHHYAEDGSVQQLNLNQPKRSLWKKLVSLMKRERIEHKSTKSKLPHAGVSAPALLSEDLGAPNDEKVIVKNVLEDKTVVGKTQSNFDDKNPFSDNFAPVEKKVTVDRDSPDEIIPDFAKNEKLP